MELVVPKLPEAPISVDRNGGGDDGVRQLLTEALLTWKKVFELEV
jgi:hypothetical protein